MVRKILPLVTLALVLAACGTVATPVAQQSVEETRIAQAATAAQETADAPTAAPTETPIPPTATPVPPTATPVPPTATTAPATATTEPTEAPTEAADAPDSGTEGSAPAGDPALGEEVFNTFIAEANFACNTCHLPNSEAQLIGPGLLNIGSRAETRVDGLSAEEYILTSILKPSEYVVDGFPDMLMPQNYADILSSEQIDNLVAYLFTLTE